MSTKSGEGHIAAYIARGQCHELLEHCVRSHEIATSEFILREYRDKLSGKLRVPVRLVEEAEALLRSRMEVVEPSPLPEPICRDPEDDAILATAAASACECLITGDKDLLALESYRGIRILAPAMFWGYEASRSEPG